MDEQRVIAEAPMISKLLVTAGPGTGKTHTLTARIAHLIQHHDIAGQEMLILSFSRAAVREIRERCKDVGGDLAYVHVSTFDSFATRLLSEFDPAGSWSQESYDGRINCAVRLLNNSPAARAYIKELRHVFVDEIQDLVAERAELVRAVLQTTHGGFTLLGDPAQGIYNFQLEGPARSVGSAALYDWLRGYFSKDLKEVTLTKNHRASTPECSAALWAGAVLNDPKGDHEGVFNSLSETINGLQSVGKYEQAAGRLRTIPEKTAILCRNNGQALLLSRTLWGQEAVHSLQRSATDRHIPSWLALSFRGYDQLLIGPKYFAERSSELGCDEAEIERRWRLLKRVEGERQKTLSLQRLNLRLRQGRLPDELHEQVDARLTVSSIHRAKGLEFDRVIIAACPEQRAGEDYVSEEARTLYVAMTRAKKSLHKIELPAYTGLQLHDRTDRWLRRRDGWKTLDFEVTPEDLDRAAPPEPVVNNGPSIPEIQDYIAGTVRRGDEVVLERVGVNDENTGAVYHILHKGLIIGRTSGTLPLTFASRLLSALRSGWRKSKLPASIESLRVEGVETIVGDPNVGKVAGLGSSGTWLSVKVGGLGRLNYGRG